MRIHKWENPVFTDFQIADMKLAIKIYKTGLIQIEQDNKKVYIEKADSGELTVIDGEEYDKRLKIGKLGERKTIE